MEKDKHQETGSQNQTEDKIKPVKINPDPRANANIPEDKKKPKPGNNDGAGTEITDGEDG